MKYYKTSSKLITRIIIKKQKFEKEKVKVAFEYIFYFLFLKIEIPIQSIRTLIQKSEIYPVFLQIIFKILKVWEFFTSFKF